MTVITAPRQQTRETWIVGPKADWPLLICAPLVALALGLLLGPTPLAKSELGFGGAKGSLADGFIAAFITAHLGLVFFRSHGNAAVLARHPIRFKIVPPLLLIALVASPWMRAAAACLAVLWDAYHSSLQTFGIGRIYDAKEGNDPRAGRALDLALNLFLYLGPILAGAKLLYHAAAFYEFSGMQPLFLAQLPPKIMAAQHSIRLALLGVGGPLIAAYLLGYRALAARGYKVSRAKACLLASTAACSIFAWGFNPFGMALFIVNFFHALQYFALVWRYERGTAEKLFGVKRAFAGFLAAGAAYGILGAALGEVSDLAYCVTLVVSLLHFWYDGFVWSVRAGHV